MDLDVYFEPVGRDDPNFVEMSERRKRILENKTRFSPLTLTIKDALKRSKIMTDPPLTQADWRLSANPAPKAVYQPPSFIFVDLPYDPMDLEHLVVDRVGIGQMALDFVEQALSKIAAAPELRKFFPFDVIREACETFEQRGYIYPFKVAEKMIPGTTVKGRIDLELSGEGTKRIFSASHRGKPLMQKEIYSLPTPELAVTGQFHGYSLYDDKIIIEENPLFVLPSGLSRPLTSGGGEIAIHDHPALLALFEEKGWLGLDERKTLAKDGVVAMTIEALMKDVGEGNT